MIRTRYYYKAPGRRGKEKENEKKRGPKKRKKGNTAAAETFIAATVQSLFSDRVSEKNKLVRQQKNMAMGVPIVQTEILNNRIVAIMSTPHPQSDNLGAHNAERVPVKTIADSVSWSAKYLAPREGRKEKKNGL